MTSALATKTCTPCQSGVPPMTAEEAQRYMLRTPGWTLDTGASRIERNFRFPDFKEALAFVDAVGAVAEEEGHHPDFRFGWGYCTIVLHTHKIKGLHENDFIMAAKVNGFYEG